MSFQCTYISCIFCVEIKGGCQERKPLIRLFTVRKEVKLIFQQQNNPKFEELLFEDYWVAELTYPADIFPLFNELNILMYR